MQTGQLRLRIDTRPCGIIQMHDPMQSPETRPNAERSCSQMDVTRFGECPTQTSQLIGVSNGNSRLSPFGEVAD